MLFSNFITYIQEQELFRLSRDRILLAVSGGIDSIALVHLCKKAGIKFGIAHCNFQLRNAESDGDARFVEQLAQQLDVPFYQINFDTEKEAQAQKKSIQVIARELRYRWLEQIRQQEGYQFIAVAHHHNDSIETLLINLTMGCGIRGLHGIFPKKGFIIRPLLFANREDILNYIEQQQFAYREDSSNANTKYVRNSIRHLVVPNLKKINPEFENTFQDNFRRFREAESLFNYAIEQLKKNCVQKKDNSIWIDIHLVEQTPAPLTLLYELLAPYQFKPSKIEYIFKRRHEESGALYSSKTHQVLRDRTHWIVSPIFKTKASMHTIASLDNSEGVIEADNLVLNWSINQEQPQFDRDSQVAHFDLNKLEFPLYLRHWRDGDLFYPIGMEGRKKKLSKYFKDIKMNRFDKDATWLLCNALQEVIWIVGHRMDERFKVELSSQHILHLKIANI